MEATRYSGLNQVRYILTKDYLRKKVVRGIHDGYDLYHNKIKIDKCNAIAMLDEYFSERGKSVDIFDNIIIFKDHDRFDRVAKAD